MRFVKSPSRILATTFLAIIVVAVVRLMVQFHYIRKKIISLSILSDNSSSRFSNRVSVTESKEIHKGLSQGINDLSSEIDVITIINDIHSKGKYVTAMKTVRCYCDYYNYTYTVIYATENSKWDLLCRQQDFFFKRHCIAAHYLMRSAKKYHLFIDGDQAVINPKRRIEEFLITNKDIIFYNRLWGFEVMAGSYFARKSFFAVDFLLNWASYFYKSYMGLDNVILHSAILDFASINKSACEKILEESHTFGEAFVYVACARNLMSEDPSWSNNIAILPRCKSWSRDGWLTYSKWSENDLMLHGLQEDGKDSDGFGYWRYPFHLNMSFHRMQCKNSTDWSYVQSLRRDNMEINYALQQITDDVRKQYRLALEDAKIFRENDTFPKKLSFRLLFAGLDEYIDYAKQFNEHNMTRFDLQREPALRSYFDCASIF